MSDEQVVSRERQEQSSRPSERPGLGILGGGQLGMFLCQAAEVLNIGTTVVEPNPQGSAMRFADSAFAASLDDAEAVERLVLASEVVTFELEAIPDNTLERLEAAEKSGSLKVFPQTATLRLLKDKGRQKAWLNQEGLPTLPSLGLPTGERPAALGKAPWTLPLVQKAHQGGYDGKGVQILRTQSDLAQLWDLPSYLEPALDPVTELAVLVVSDRSGNLRSYPPVSMTFDDRYNAVHAITSPAQVDDPLVAQCRVVAEDAVSRLNSCGAFAVELFVDQDRQIFINEISPRVHNSGHLSLEGFDYSQFELHVRAVMGLPLPDPRPTAPSAVMINILYEPELKASCPDKPMMVKLHGAEPVTIHWYGKSTGQPGRKMGHLTATGSSSESALRAAESALENLKTASDHSSDSATTKTKEYSTS